ncbi:protein FAR1-RELATED SEQUENCE 5-like [Ipomoea triloba]|uniref:protein FAR1-RELATED SEQUENCE 5-like n=1 Tax=Ipomoea triloba TaxID=35885 RepID=UPI00125D5C08|nr:protein FAR1-RELATED SEQUENCE 5-like [Ipomoea triloba]
METGMNMNSASGVCDEGYSTDIGVEGSACDMEISPGMTKYWRPICANSLKPHVGQQFDSLDSAFGFYKQYAGFVGFDCRQSTTRKGRDGGIVLKHVLCSGKHWPYSQDTLFKRRELCEAFGFEYDVDESDQLSRVFLADAVSRKNFSLFGDVVSFDATYRSNRYNLVFVPFTDIDNHKRCITFGAGLLTKEDIDSYLWLLESFKKIMGHDSICVVTDQDPAVKVVVAQVFGASKHRFCMWHIMCKVGEKVGPVLSKDEVFRRKLNCIVWDNSIDPEAFELRWNQIMEKYGLGDNGWFRYLFESPVHFGHLHTFMMSLWRVCAIGAQRHAQAKLNADCEACFPVLKTPLTLERHAMGVYTISVFYDVQEEICAACFSCQVVSLSDSDGCVSYVIKDGDHRAWAVDLVLDDNCARCSCKMFERMGLLCKHIFFVFKDRGLESIPSRYLVHQWTKGACLHPIFDIDGIVVDQSAKVENVRLLTNLMWSDIYACVGLADGNIDRLSQIRSVINDQMKLFLQDGSENGSSVAVGSKQSVINLFCGSVSKASTVEVHDPVKAKNKGSGKRLKSGRELQASVQSNQGDVTLVMNMAITVGHVL